MRDRDDYTLGGFRFCGNEKEMEMGDSKVIELHDRISMEKEGGVEDRRIPFGYFPWNEIPDREEFEEAITAIVEGQEAGKEEGADEQFPVRIISGIAGEFAKLYGAYVESPAEFLYISFLTYLGSVLAERLTLASEIRPQPRLYVLLLGESADTRKSTAIKKTVEFFEEFFGEVSDGSVARFLAGRFDVSWSVGSAEGLQKRLGETNPLLLCFDEFKAFLGKCSIQASVLLPCVTTLFENNAYENRTAHSNIVLHDVHLSILAASTLETYEKAWDAAFTDIGLTNRLFIVPARGERRFSVPREVPDWDKTMRTGKRLVKCLLDGAMRYIGSQRKLDMTEGARARFDEWYRNLERSIHAKRLDTYALRLMPLLAFNDFKTVVDEETVEKVIALMDWQLAVRQQYDPIDAENAIARVEEKIRRRLKKGPHGERELRRFVNADRFGIRIFQWALGNLRSAGDVVYDNSSKKYKLSDGEY